MLTEHREYHGENILRAMEKAPDMITAVKTGKLVSAQEIIEKIPLNELPHIRKYLQLDQQIDACIKSGAPHDDLHEQKRLTLAALGNGDEFAGFRIIARHQIGLKQVKDAIMSISRQ